LMFTLAFFAVWHYPLMNIANARNGAPYKPNRAKEIARLFLRPLQGFFNAIIFIHHKVRNFRNQHPELSLYEALKKVFAIREDEPEHIVSNLTLVKRDDALGLLEFAFDGHHSDSGDGEDEDEDDSVDDRGRSSLKKDCDPKEMELTGSVEGGRVFICSPDPSVEPSVQDLEGFFEDSLCEQINVVMDDDTTTPLHRSENESSVRDLSDRSNHDLRSPLSEMDAVHIDNVGDSVY